MSELKILMVCLGNICRSPLAHGILQHKVNQRNLDWEVESCGTSSFHVGEGPDPRSVKTAKENGIDISRQRSLQFDKSYFGIYDHILVMDASNYRDVMHQAESKSEKDKVKLIMNYLHKDENRQVPDPYYGGGFQMVYDMLDAAIDKFIEEHDPS